MILLDTDVIIDIFDKKSKRGEEALRRIEVSGDGVGTSSINFHEVAYGILKRSRALEEFLRFPILPYTREDAVLSSKIEVALEKKGTAVRRADAMIAAVAIGSACPIFTFDKKRFEPMGAFGLRLFE